MFFDHLGGRGGFARTNLFNVNVTIFGNLGRNHKVEIILWGGAGSDGGWSKTILLKVFLTHFSNAVYISKKKHNLSLQLNFQILSTFVSLCLDSYT